MSGKKENGKRLDEFGQMRGQECERDPRKEIPIVEMDGGCTKATWFLSKFRK